MSPPQCPVQARGQHATSRTPPAALTVPTWQHATVPLLVHATKQILGNRGEDGWELVAVMRGPNPATQATSPTVGI